jgi:6-phosphogluconolactonase (cycloisomerase 2 family)
MGGIKVMRGRRVVTAGLAFGVTLIAAGAALGATGEITPQFCIDDNDPPVGDACAVGTDGLGGVVAAVASPDGRSLYTASVTDDAVTEFARTPSGALETRVCTDDNDAALDACQNTTDGLDGAFSVAISPDGRSVYAAGFDDDAIVRFDRDPDTGALTPLGCVDDGDAGQGPDDCSQTADGLDGVISITVSPDGKSVYAASLDDDAVVLFERDTATGGLSPLGCVDDNDSGADDCAQTTNGLDGARSIAVSPDGESVYAVSGPDDAIVRMSRDPQTGRLTPQGCIDDQDSGADSCSQTAVGLDGARTVVVSPDGDSVYVGSQIDDAVVRFDRVPASGALSFEGCIGDDESGAHQCEDTADGLDGVFSLSVSADGLSLYAAALDDDAVARFDRDPDSGALTAAGCIDDNDDPEGPDDCAGSADGLNGAIGVASSAGTTSLYVLSVYDEAVLWLVRDDQTPPNTTITRRPTTKTKKRRASFEFVSSEPFSTYECKLDKRGFKPCPSPRTYGRQLLKPGKHTFRVRALDEPGNTDPTPARVRWKVRG